LTWPLVLWHHAGKFFGITPERQKAVDFSDPYYSGGGQIAAKPWAKNGRGLARQGGGGANRLDLAP
jgi:hypothetical protein